MPAKRSIGGVNAADVDAKLPKSFFLRRGHVQAAFGLADDEMSLLVASGVFRAEYPFGKKVKKRRRGKVVEVEQRACFVRSQVLELARKMEAQS